MGFRWNPPPEPLPKESGDSHTPQHLGGQEDARATQSSSDGHGIAFSPGRLFNPLSFDADVGRAPPPPPPPPPPQIPSFPAFSSVRPASYHAEGPPTMRRQRLIPPNTPFARAVVMGNTSSTDQHGTSAAASNLTMQMNQIPLRVSVNVESDESNVSSAMVDEADSASGPSPLLAHSLPAVTDDRGNPPSQVLPMLQQDAPASIHQLPSHILKDQRFRKSRRCVSSKELGTIAPPSGSPYAEMLHKREEIESAMRDRLTALREAEPYQRAHIRPEAENSTDSMASARERSNQKRNQRRAEHTQAVIDDLCEVVTDLFVAESKLLNPSKYGVSETATSRDPILNNIRMFVTSLPVRYALGVDTPSEVLLHMRLMAAARAEHAKVAIHIHSIEEDSLRGFKANDSSNQSLRLVTMSCRDATGLLEYITSLLATGGSRVLDADVMTSEDGIVLDRFVVNMAGRLRLDMLSDSVEAFLSQHAKVETPIEKPADTNSKKASQAINHVGASSGSIYHTLIESTLAEERLHSELQSGVPLTEMLATNSKADLTGAFLPMLSKRHSLPSEIRGNNPVPLPEVTRSAKNTGNKDGVAMAGMQANPINPVDNSCRRKLVDRPASHDLDKSEEVSMGSHKTIDYVTVPTFDQGGGVLVEKNRSIPLVPFDELMLIETIGTGRVSTIYRAAWQRQSQGIFSEDKVKMVALKVAMTNGDTGDTSFIDELRQEADIAARLQHACICDLIGVAADAECFCLAYEYCSGGSLLSLLTDHSRYYEYLPIALDIANGMAYLHSRNVIHRDLKPSNILLTKNHRAKIADFGMSISNHGQELTAETGTYREVIRHESYSSNADVYSFGICLWQLITREIPFATMTPIQAAYAVAQGQRPEIPPNTPAKLKEIIRASWNQDSYKRPSFTYIALALADYAKLAFSPANVGTQTLLIANELLATVEGNSTVNVDFTAPVNNEFMTRSESFHNIGLEIE